jgi:hypothetical protein
MAADCNPASFRRWSHFRPYFSSALSASVSQAAVAAVISGRMIQPWMSAILWGWPPRMASAYVARHASARINRVIR